MKQKIFTDLKGVDLIIKYRESAVFFCKKYKETDLEEHRNGGVYIDGEGLEWRFNFTADVFKDLYEFLLVVAKEIWTTFELKQIDSLGAEYDDYYDKEFDNNGSLRLSDLSIYAGGPYAQPPNKDCETRLMKFNKRKLESFLYDLKRKLKE